MCVAVRNTLLISDDGRQVTIHPYSGKYKPKQDVSIGTVATLWIHPDDGQPYILVLHEALYSGDRVDVTLLNPNQLRTNGVNVEDVPRQFDPTSSVHSIYHPTWAEYEECPHIELTSPMRWDPSSDEIAKKGGDMCFQRLCYLCWQLIMR